MPNLYYATNDGTRFGFPSGNKTTTAGRFDSARLDGAWTVNGYYDFTFGEQASDYLYIHFEHKWVDNNNWDGWTHRFYDAAGNQLGYFDLDNGNWRLLVQTGGTPLTDKYDCADYAQGTFGFADIYGIMNNNQLDTIDVAIITDDAVVGSGNMGFRVWQNGIIMGTVVSPNTSLMGKPARINWGNTDNGDQYVSGVMVADFCTVGMFLTDLAPSGDGSDVGWDNDYTALNDGDALTSRTGTGGKVSVTVPDTVDQHGQPYQVVVHGDVLTSAEDGPFAAFQFFVDVNDVDYVQSGTNTLDTLIGGFEYAFETNPETGGGWSWSAVDDLEYGISV